MKKTAIIFDHDGTLVDSLEAIVITTNLALEKNGFKSCPPGEIRRGMSLSTDRRLELHSGCSDMKVVKKLTKDFFELMHSEGIPHMKVYDGIRETLDALASCGYPMGMVSNNMGIIIRKAAARLHYAYDLEIMLGDENVRALKPEPDGILQACAGLAAEPEDCWYIGDAGFDLKAARAAGCKSGLVTWGAYSEEELSACNPDALFRTPSELKEYFLNLC